MLSLWSIGSLYVKQEVFNHLAPSFSIFANLIIAVGSALCICIREGYLEVTGFNDISSWLPSSGRPTFAVVSIIDRLNS